MYNNLFNKAHQHLAVVMRVAGLTAVATVACYTVRYLSAIGSGVL
jgi:hypothetical protein